MNIDVDIGRQQLSLFDNQTRLKQYVISTAKNGPGEKVGSEKTPRGQHIIRAKIGSGEAVNSVFIGRRATDEIYSTDLRTKEPGRDWILSRILWLSGIEPGFNRLGDVDTMRRYIYIHGCPDDDELGIPGSHGCIKMRNNDVIELFDLVLPGIPVLIHE